MKKLKSDYKMLWALISLMLFAGIIVSASLLQGFGSKNSFSVSIVSPAGDEEWQGDTLHTVTYRISDGTPNYTVELFYTTDNVNFNFIDYDNRTAKGTFYYIWTAPEITSNTVRIRVNVTDNTTEQVSDISNTFEIDSTPPGEVMDLDVWNITKISVTLNWTAPGDDNNTGTATSYDVRYYTSAITESNWNSAVQVADEPTPSSAGNLESFTVTGLSPGTTYYFALKSRDNVGFISNLSNCVNASTLLNVELISPTWYKEWKGNTNYTVEYKIAGTEPNYTVKLYYAYNNSDFIFIGYDNRTEAGTHQYNYNWTTPNILSVSVKVKINVTDATSFSDVKISDEFEIDSIPPGRIDDLTVTGVTTDSVTLNWTAPGEDGGLYKINLTNDEAQDLAIPDYDPTEPTNVTSNLTVNENIMIDKIRVYLRINHTYISNLIINLSHPDNTTITLFNRSGGNAANIWGWYEGNIFTPDSGSGSPDSADSLFVFNNKGSEGVWKLFVSDNAVDYTGVIDYWKIELVVAPVTVYDIRYNETAEITEENWGDSFPCTNEPIPAEPGTSETLSISGLSPGIKYYFALKSNDNVEWESVLSNCVNGTTLLDVEVLSPDGGEIWSGKSTHLVRYSFSGVKPDPYSVYAVSIYYTYDNITKHIVNLSHNDSDVIYEFEWSTSMLNSTNVKVLVNVTTYALYSYGQDESDGNFILDSESPKIISTLPENNAYVLHDENIVITFSEPMNKTSVESAFSITPSVANLVWAWNDNFTMATISHDNFTKDQLYMCIINTTVRDVSEPGNPLLKDYFFNFTVVEPLSVRVIYPNGNETWNGTKNQTIAYKILGGIQPYNVTIYWVNATDGVTELIGYDTNSSAGENSWTWASPSITNNTLKIKISVIDNTTPIQTTSDLSDWIFEIDSTAPGKPKLEPPAPDSIAVEGYPRAHAVKLNWEASGDDGDIGKVSYYDIRCYNTYITEDNWDDIPSYWRFEHPAVAFTGKFDSYVINDLEPDTVYYFRLKAYDNVGFVSELSECISIETLKFEIWSDTMEGVPDFEWIDNTLNVISSKTVSYTEVLMKGNLRVVNNAEFKFEKVLFIMDCTEDWEYRIQVAPGGLAGYLEGGKFELQYSNISASVSTMPDGSERWHPYLFVAYRNSIFWMFDSSMHHCGGKPEDIENIELDFVQMDVELDVELGIEIRSSDVSIENSILSQNWGIFIRSSLPMEASPTIKNNIISHNRYGIIIKPRIDIAEQWPINLRVNNISNNGVGVYSDSARVGLEGCWFTGNNYAVIYNNTPTDYPSNVSGVIYHCVFENNVMAIKSTSSSLKLSEPYILNNTRFDWSNSEITNNFYSTIHSLNSTIEINGGRISDNAYIYCDQTSISDVMLTTIYSKFSVLNITGATISRNNGAFYRNTTIVNHMSASSMDMDTMSVTIYHEESYISIIQTNITDNGKPFYAHNSKYLINITYPESFPDEDLAGTTEEIKVPDDKTFSGPGTPGIVWYHIAVIYTQLSYFEFRDSVFSNNLEGIICLANPSLIIENSIIKGENTMLGPHGAILNAGWHTTEGWIATPRITYGIISVGSPLTFRDNELSEFILGIVSAGAEIDFTGNSFEHNVICSIIAASRDIGGIPFPFPKILFQDFWDRIEGVNVVASMDNNNFYANGIQIIAGFATLNMNHNNIAGSRFDDIYASQVGMVLASTTVNMNDTTMYALWVDILATEELYFEAGEQELNLSQYFTGNLTSGLMENLTFGNASITLTNSNLGGLFLELGNSYLEMKDCEMETNLVPIYAKDSTVTLDNVYIHDSLTYSGYHYTGEFYFENSTISFKDCYINNSFTYSCVSSTVTLESSTFTDNIHGFGGIDSKDSEISIDDCNMLDNRYGVYVSSNSVLTVTSTTFSDNNNGIYCVKSELYLEGNENIFSNNSYAVTLTDDSSGKIANSTITDSRWVGIYITYTEGDIEVKDNTLKNNKNGVFCYESPYVTIMGNTIMSNISYETYETFGVYCVDSSPQIIENQIYYFKTGIVCQGSSSPNITGNYVSDCRYGIAVVGTSGPTITNNTIKNNLQAGIVSESENSFIAENNTVTGSRFGIAVEWASGITITNSTISENIFGIILWETLSVSYINNTVISNNSYGLSCLGASPEVSNTTIVNNTAQQEWYSTSYYPEEGKPGLSNPENVIGKPDDKFTIIYDGQYVMASDYDFMYWGGLSSIEKLEIGFRWRSENFRENEKDYMLIRYSLDGGETYGTTNYTDRNNYETSQTYYLDVTGDGIGYISQLCVEGRHVKVENKGHGYISLDSMWIRITSNHGVYLFECPASTGGQRPKFINTRITDNIHDLILDTSSVECVESNLSKVILYNSFLECIDFTPDFNNITFADNGSKVEVSFYLTVFVKWQNNEPVNNASVTIYNVNNVPTNLSTDSNGIVYTKILALKLNKTTLPDGVTFMPHRVEVSKYDIFNETEEIWVNKTKDHYVELVLYDINPPSVFINPLLPYFDKTNKELLELDGTANDTIEVRAVEISIDNINWINCDLVTINDTLGNYNVSWSGTITLNEGFNIVYVRVKDFAGNNATGSINITLDTTAPVLTITSDIPETTNQPTLTITGNVTGETDGVNLTINTVSVPIINNTFSKIFNLNEGVNVFTIIASDALGNENRKVLSIIVFDNTPPTSGIAPINDYVNTLTSVSGVANDDISGIKKVEICIIKDGSYWTGSAWSSTEKWINVSEVVVSGTTAAWSYPWTLESEGDGVYTIKSRATDNADNIETPSSSVTFTYDKTPPTLTNIKPSNNTKTESGTITVSGETDGVNVKVNGVDANVEDGKFSATVKLGTGNNGRNVITIIATDMAGNTNQTTIIVKRTSGWVPPPTAWIGLLAGIIVIALIVVVFVLYKKKIIKLKPKKGKEKKGLPKKTEEKESGHPENATEKSKTFPSILGKDKLFRRKKRKQ